MPILLSDPPLSVLITFLILGVFLSIFWYATRSRYFLFAAIPFTFLAVFLFVTDRLFESPREIATRKMKAFAEATQAKNVAEAFKEVSEQFRYERFDKRSLFELARAAQSEPSYNGIAVSGFSRANASYPAENQVKIGFDVWPAGIPLPEYRFYCEATFQREGDDYRLRTIELFKSRPGPNDRPIVPDRLR